ncbi:MAG: hypothetical protein IJR50_05530 [Treponema sp.]|nr:hypothetical protein [Treponema sp.]
MKNLQFALNVRYTLDSENIYFKKGIWNTIDGIIPLNSINDKTEFLQLLKRIESNGYCIETFKTHDEKLIEELLKNGFIIDCEKKEIQIAQVLTGNEFIEKSASQNFDFITDSDFLSDELARIKNIYNFKANIIKSESLEELHDVNYFSKVNSLEYEKKMNLCRKKFNFPAPKLVIFENVSLPVFRNLNEIFNGVPVSYGFLDGPFMIFTTLMNGQTGCWNCFENRMMTNVRDMVLYNRFKDIKPIACKTDVFNLHLTQLLHFGLEEVFSWNLLNMTKFMGRAYFVYLPTFEFHLQNVDRLSSCETCGYLSINDAAEDNISLQRIISEL